jgi:hypothetical protein
MTTTASINPDTSPQILQTYTLLQIAAEAMFGVKHPDPAAPAGSGAVKNPTFGTNGTVLIEGNSHSSKFTQKQAQDFSNDWEAISHQPNTATGFSATLFKLKAGRADASKGTYEGQHVVAFRSTEFIEDAARDNMAANTMEVQPGGWAFGQIADMQLWWASVQGQLGGANVDVTGYSLGGHLATAFYQLHGPQADNRIGKVYTFNGAGVGDVKPGQGGLAGVMARFEAQRQQGANEALFTDPVAKARYRELSDKLHGRATLAALSVKRANMALHTVERLLSVQEEFRHAA